jgi:hypothetical protein
MKISGNKGDSCKEFHLTRKYHSFKISMYI